MRLLLSILILFIAEISNSQNSNQWEQCADFGSFGRHRAVAVGIGNKVYAGTGHLNGTGWDTWYSEWWEYDPATNAWTQKADYIGNNGTGDQDLSAIEIDGIGYFGEGWYGGMGHYKYDPSINSWTELSIPPINVANTIPFVIDGKGYYASWGSNMLYMYDPILDLWTAVSQMPTTAGQRDPTFVIANKGYFKKGTDFFEYDPSTNLWTTKASFPGAGELYNLGLSQYGYGFIIGGLTNGLGDLYQEVWRYDPTIDSWSQMEDHPFSARRWAVRAKVGEKCYVGLGTNGTNFNDWWQFDAFANFEDIEDDMNVSVFPNPVIDELHVASKKLQSYDVKIFNIQGELVLSAATQTGSINLSMKKTPPGTYIYKVFDDSNVIKSGRIIVQ